jgi:hypothetical protein
MTPVDVTLERTSSDRRKAARLPAIHHKKLE